MIVFLDPAKDGLIDRIVSGCAEPVHQDRSFIRELADGFPSMAVRATSAVREARDPLLSVDDLVERILWGRALPDQEAARALGAASLFHVVEAFGDGSTWSVVDCRLDEPLADQTEAQMREHLERFRNGKSLCVVSRFSPRRWRAA